MSEHRAILEAVSELQRIQLELQQIRTRTDEGRKLDMVGLRRDLSAQVGVLATLGRTLSATPDLARDYGTRLSAMRSAIALHQSVWPVVSIDHDAQEYQQSATKVRAESAAFVAWVKANLGQETAGKS